MVRVGVKVGVLVGMGVYVQVGGFTVIVVAAGGWVWVGVNVGCGLWVGLGDGVTVLPVEGGVRVVLGRGVMVAVAVSVRVTLVAIVDAVWVAETVRLEVAVAVSKLTAPVAVGGIINVPVGLNAGAVLVGFRPA